MQFSQHQDQACLRVVMQGAFTFADHEAFRMVIDRLRAEDARRVVLEMGQVDFIDSAALGMLLLAHDEAKKNHLEIAIAGASGQVRKMMEIARFDTLFVMS